MRFGESYVELPIKAAADEWEFSPEARFLHRFYYFDMLGIEIRQEPGGSRGYSVLAYARKSYEHISFPEGGYNLDRREKMTLKLAGDTDKERAFSVYRAWKYLFGL